MGTAWAIGGGALQVAALIWGWVALYRLWRLRWPGSPLVPWFPPAKTWVARKWEGLRYWLTLIPRQHTIETAATSLISVTGHVDVTVNYADDSVEAQLARMEKRFGLMEEHHANEIRRVLDAVDGVTDAQRANRSERDEEAKRTTRSALIGPAAFAGVGTIAQLAGLLL